MTHTKKKLDILCLPGQDEFTNIVKQSDLSILKDELGSKKVEINIIQHINDLAFKNPLYIHSLTDCYRDYETWTNFVCRYKQMQISNPSLPNIIINSVDIYNDLEILVRIRKLNLPLIKLLDMGIITQVNYRNNMPELIKQYMDSKQVSKAFIRFTYGHCPSFLVDLNDESSFNINYDDYTTKRIQTSNIIIHPLKNEKAYMKGVISIIYIDDKYSHAILKKPCKLESGIRRYTIARYSPSYGLLQLSRSVVSKLNSTGKSPIIQLNFCHNTDSIYSYLLTKINYIDPKLYFKVNKKAVKKVSKMMLQTLK